MYTQCPKCLTYFQVTADHLKVAQGNVRCGQCSNVFSALGNLSEKPPQGASNTSPANTSRQTKPTPSPAKRPASAENSAQSKLNSAIAAIQALNQSSQKILSQSRKNYVTQLQRQAQAKRKYTNLDARASTAPDLNREDLDSEAVSALANDLHETSDPNIDFDQALAAIDEIEIDVNKDNGTENEEHPIQYGLDDDEDITPSFDGSHLVEDYAIEDSFVTEDSQNTQPAAPFKASSTRKSDENELDFSELDLPVDEPPETTTSRQQNKLDKQTKTQAKPKAQPKVNATKQAKPKESRPTKVDSVPDMIIENNIPTLAIPKQLLEDFQEEQHIHPAHYRSMITWGLGSLMLMFVFLGQTIYFKHNELGQISQLRPWIEYFCKHASCELSLQMDIGQIELLGQDIRSHPKSKKALLVSATIINNAPFSQPYPGLQLNFSDMNGEKVAMRNFLPKDYLPSNINAAKGMESNIPIQLELEIVDPGTSAVNFEFDFFPI
jgi:predicted Zn finger-like uncharacterized protein